MQAAPDGRWEPPRHPRSLFPRRRTLARKTRKRSCSHHRFPRRLDLEVGELAETEEAPPRPTEPASKKNRIENLPTRGDDAAPHGLTDACRNDNAGYPNP